MRWVILGVAALYAWGVWYAAEGPREDARIISGVLLLFAAISFASIAVYAY